MRRMIRHEKPKVGEFRLLLRLGTDVNVTRFKKHVAKLEHQLYWDLTFRKIKIKARRARRVERLAVQLPL